MKIAIVTPRHLLDEFKQMVQRNGLQDRFVYWCYGDFEHMERLYRENHGKVAGMLLTGNIPYAYLRMRYPDDEVPMAFVENNSLLHACLRLVAHQQKHPDIPLNQLFCDFLGEVKVYNLFREHLPARAMPYTISATHLNQDFLASVAQTAQTLYQEGKIKKALLTMGSVYENIKAAGVPCELVPIRPENMLAGLNEILDMVDNQGAVPHPSMLMALADYSHAEDISGDYNELLYREVTLMKVLLDYRKTVPGPLAPNIASVGGKVEITMPAATGENPMEPMEKCLAYMLANTSLPVATGVGVGRNLQDCRVLADNALRHAVEFGGRHVFARQKNQLTGPLFSAECINVDTELSAMTAGIAKKLKMTHGNYIRLLALITHEDITSARVAEFLNVTQRSANRMIATMLAHSMIVEVPQKSTTAGRPLKTYTLSNRILMPD